MRKHLFIILILIPQTLFADNFFEKQKLVGSGSFNYYIWHVYDIKLYSKTGTFSFNKPFTIELVYQRKLYADEIAEGAIDEIKNLGFNNTTRLEKWQHQMQKIFPDIDQGMHLIGSYEPNKQTVFYQNGKRIGTIEDPEFGKWFFGIWLNEKTSEPELRKKLLGM